MGKAVKHDYLQYKIFRQKMYNKETLFTVSKVQFQVVGLVFGRNHKRIPESRSGSLDWPDTFSNITEYKYSVILGYYRYKFQCYCS